MSRKLIVAAVVFSLLIVALVLFGMPGVSPFAYNRF